MTPHAVVLGGGAGVWEDLLAVETLLGRQWDGMVVVVNDVGVHWPRRMDAWCSLHPAKFPAWRKQRQLWGFPEGYATYGRHAHTADAVITEQWPGGSSGLLAVQVALARGARRVTLCGVPMTTTPHFQETRERHIWDERRQWRHADKHWKAWVRYREHLQAVVRSMSGRTRELLGAPDAAWLSNQRGVA